MQNTAIGRKTDGQLVTAHSRRRVHGADYLYLGVQLDEVQVRIEPFVSDQLLEKRDQLDCVILVRLRQVDVL